MSDPAIEAAQHAWDRRYPGGSVRLAASAYEDGIGSLAIDAAREALNPVREVIESRYGESSMIDDLLDDLARLVNPESELS